MKTEKDIGELLTQQREVLKWKPTDVFFILTYNEKPVSEWFLNYKNPLTQAGEQPGKAP